MKSVLTNEDFLYAFDEEKGYACKYAELNKNPEIVEDIRKCVRKIYEMNGYLGFDDECDRYFDKNGMFLYIEKNDEIVSCLRVVKKGDSNLLPFEMAIISNEPGRRYVANEKVLDLNSFVFSDPKSIDLLLACTSDWINRNAEDLIFCLYDPNNKSIERFYRKFGFENDINYNSPIFFPGYKKNISGKLIPVEWKILVVKKENLNIQLEKRTKIIKYKNLLFN